MLRASTEEGFNLNTNSSLEDIYENYTYTLVALLKPQIVSGEITTVVRSPSGPVQKSAAKMLPYAIRKVDHESRFMKEVGAAATDFILGWSVMEVRYENLSLDQSDEAVIPVIRHVCPDDVMALPGAKRWEHAGAFFRKRVMPKAKLLAMAKEGNKRGEGWKIDKIKALETYDGGSTYETRDVLYYEGWMLPDDEKDLPGKLEPDGEGFHGVDFLCDEDGNFLRNPWRHVGPKMAPYYIAGATYAADCMYPIGVAVAAANNNDLVEEVISVLLDKTRRMQTKIFAKMGRQDLETALKESVDEIIPVGPMVDFKDLIHVANVEGPRQEQFMMVEMARQMMDRVSGVTDMQRGQTGSRVSATEASIVNSAAGARLDGLISSFYEMIRDGRVEQSWAMVTDSDVKLHLSDDASRDGELQSPEWQGGLPDGLSYYALGLEISVASGHRTNPEILANRYVRALDIAMMVAKLKQMFPDTNVEDTLRRVYDTMQVSEMRELVLGEPAPDPKAGLDGGPGNGAMIDARSMPAIGQGAPMAMGMAR
ncbi:MAG: hypothetical protein KDB61_00245 [Planctomycetes bacterium]|nr:hypothetical protein [Planctomycetota bacterium]